MGGKERGKRGEVRCGSAARRRVVEAREAEEVKEAEEARVGRRDEAREETKEKTREEEPSGGAACDAACSTAVMSGGGVAAAAAALPERMHPRHTCQRDDACYARPPCIKAGHAEARRWARCLERTEAGCPTRGKQSVGRLKAARRGCRVQGQGKAGYGASVFTWASLVRRVRTPRASRMPGTGGVGIAHRGQTS